jgi:two-component system chemotaxis response regulator CheY
MDDTKAAVKSNRTFKILIVDDEEDIRNQFTEILTELSNHEDWEISQAVDGVDALAKAEATKFDLILLDIVMPNKDGIQTLSEIKGDPAKYGTPRILMITNIGGDLATEEAMRLGAVGYRVKLEVEPMDLIKVVEEQIAQLNQAPEDTKASQDTQVDQKAA